MTEQEERKLTRKQVDAELDLTELVRVNVCALVDDVRQVRVMGTAQPDDVVVVTVRVASDDIGKLIGKQGRTARSLRTICGAAGMKLGMRCQLDILDDKRAVQG